MADSKQLKNDPIRLYVGSITMLVSSIVICTSIYFAIEKISEKEIIITLLIFGGVGFVIGIIILIGLLPSAIRAPGIEVDFENEAAKYYAESVEIEANHEARSLDAKVEEERQAYAAKKDVPGDNAPTFDVLKRRLVFNIIPVSDRMVPMYLLDDHFRIVDWNNAFSLAFDKTMEGRRGQNVLEWTYFLDNYKEVLDHGVETFKDPSALPNIDVEDITYTSTRYGTFDAKKRAYKIPSDDGDTLLGWLVILELMFRNPGKKKQFSEELIRLEGIDNLWTEYSISYDRVLLNTNVYNELLDTMVGEIGELAEIPNNSRVLDLGAGTGNITERLAKSRKELVVVALDNNSAMIEILKSKCIEYLSDDDQYPGVIVRKQDVTSLFGLKDDYFNYVILNNVLYSLPDPIGCLREIYRVLETGGEVRISGPKSNTDLEVLFEQIKTDLTERRLFAKLRKEFDHVRRINRLRLRPFLYQWNVTDVEDMLSETGFSRITYSSEEAYAGQAMIVGAVK